ncbi:MAG TPA: NADH-quinone oxidoreductase subunit E, partial [Dongiaceae bacterium]|nr:NADH-quinone oxidoreductase subunit E [Dongiaceae bacterium]
GILLAMLGGIDEIGLRGRGRAIMPAGIAVAIGGLLLGGAPVGLLDKGNELVDAAASEAGAEWVLPALVLGAACTGAAVLRAAARIFLGWGEMPGEEERAPSEDEPERGNRPLWLMMIPVSLLLALALASGASATGAFVLASAARFVAWDGGASLGHLGAPPAVPPLPPPHPFLPWLTTGLSILIAGHDLARKRLPAPWLTATNRLMHPLAIVIDRLHDGIVGDYVAWIIAGLAFLSLSFVIVGG